MYKEFEKTESNTYDDIARQAYGTPEKAGNIAKSNNNIESGKVLAFIEDESTKEPEEKEVALVSGDDNYTDFSEYSLIDGLNAVKGAVFIFNNTDTDYNYKIGDDVTIFDEEGIFLKGRVANIKNAVRKRARSSQVEIKSHAGVLLESVMPYPHEFTSLSIKDVLTLNAEIYNQKITFSDELELEEVFSNEIGTSFTSNDNETVFDFMNRICRSRGLLLTDTGDGLFVGRYKANTEEKLNLIYGECVGLEEMFFNATGDGLGRYYEINSQYPASASSTIQIPYPAPIIKRFNSNDYNSRDLESIGVRLACEDIGKHYELVAVLSENKYINSGSFAVVKNPDVGIKEETDFVIKEVWRKHPDRTILTMTLPCAYTYEIPEQLPLC